MPKTVRLSPHLIVWPGLCSIMNHSPLTNCPRINRMGYGVGEVMAVDREIAEDHERALNSECIEVSQLRLKAPVMKLWFSTFVFLLGMSIALLGCTDKPKGACLRGAGVYASCSEDFVRSQCDLVSGRFYEGLTCSNLGFRYPLNTAPFRMRHFELVLTAESDPGVYSRIGLGTATYLEPATPSLMSGSTDIQIYMKSIRHGDGRSLPQIYNVACPYAPPMPPILQVSAHRWVLSTISGSDFVEAVFDASTPDRIARLRLAMPVSADGPDVLYLGGTFTTWSFVGGERGERGSNKKCAFRADGRIAVTWEVAEL